MWALATFGARRGHGSALGVAAWGSVRRQRQPALGRRELGAGAELCRGGARAVAAEEAAARARVRGPAARLANYLREIIF